MIEVLRKWECINHWTFATLVSLIYFYCFFLILCPYFSISYLNLITMSSIIFFLGSFFLHFTQHSIFNKLFQKTIAFEYMFKPILCLQDFFYKFFFANFFHTSSSINLYHKCFLFTYFLLSQCSRFAFINNTTFHTFAFMIFFSC